MTAIGAILRQLGLQIHKPECVQRSPDAFYGCIDCESPIGLAVLDRHALEPEPSSNDDVLNLIPYGSTVLGILSDKRSRIFADAKLI